jgi:hypothetical protein
MQFSIHYQSQLSFPTHTDVKSAKMVILKYTVKKNSVFSIPPNVKSISKYNQA